MKKDEEERIPLPGGPPTPDEDVAANRAHKEQLLHAPATPEQRAAQQAYFDALRARGDRGAVFLTPRQKRVNFALVQIEAAQETIWFLAMLEDEDRSPNHAARIDQQYLQTAAALFVLGEFTQARDWCPETETEAIARYTEFADALARDDNDECDCEDSRVHQITGVVGSQVYTRELVEPHHQVIGDFPSPLHNRWVWAIRCLVCGDLNLRPELTASADLQVQASASGLSDAEAMKPNGSPRVL